MANNYPITIEEMSQIQGVGVGKAKKYGENFLSMIKNYVDNHNIERPSDMAVKTIVNKSSNKVYIIQSLDKKLSLDDIAKSRGLSNDEIISEIETIVESGTRLDIDYLLSTMMDQDEQEDLIDFFKGSNDFSLEEARQEFDEDEFSDEEIRMVRIQFISKIGN